jgi:hypothetical protein
MKAFRSGTPVGDQDQAVLAARAFLSSTKLENLIPPEVVVVQQRSVAGAQKEIAKNGGGIGNIPPETPVWFVIFKGKWLVHHPFPGVTEPPPTLYEGCQYVWISELNNGFGATGDIPCPDK